MEIVPRSGLQFGHDQVQRIFSLACAKHAFHLIAFALISKQLLLVLSIPLLVLGGLCQPTAKTEPAPTPKRSHPEAMEEPLPAASAAGHGSSLALSSAVPDRQRVWALG